MKKTEILSHQISYKETGEQGPYLIFIHGYGGSTSDWTAVADQLISTHRVIVPNLSNIYLDPHRATSFSQQVLILKEFLKIFKKSKNDQLYVVGASYGAALVYGVAIDEPDLISKIALLNPMPPSPHDHMKNPIMKYLMKLGNYPPAMALLLMSPAGRLGLPYIQNIFNVSWLQNRIKKTRLVTLNQKKIKMITHVIHRFSWISATEDWSLWRARLGIVTAPVHVIYGGRDNLFSEDSYTQLANKFLKSETTRIPHGGHVISRECSDEVLEILQEFLKTGAPKLSVVKEIS